MKIFLLSGLVAWIATTAFATGLPGAADADWAALQDAGLFPFRQAGDLSELPARERSVMREHQAERLRERGQAFFENHPTDPRRWDIVATMMVFSPRFITAYGPDYAHDDTNVTIDAATAAAWQTRLDALDAAAGVASDIYPQTRESVNSAAVMNTLRPLNKFLGDGQQVEWEPLLARVRSFIARYPASEARPLMLMTQFMFFYEMVHPPEASAAVWREFSASPNQALCEGARARMRFFAVAPQLADLKFTAVDGRSVDLAKLRGKAVLVEFWATWCAPCKEEIPNVVANYKKYHDRGFEVIGIALENASLSPGDTADQTAAKLAKAKKILTDFTAKNDMPWPQFFAGQVKQSEIARQQAIEIVPAMYLLDQDGRVVGTNVRGPVLAACLKQLLKL